MSNNDDQSKVEKEIESLDQKIQEWEDTDPAYMVEGLKDLRHRIMYVHMRLESSLEYLIVRDLVGWDREKSDGKVNAKKMGETMAIMGVVFEKMEIANKINACQKLELITSNLASSLFKVNDYRKHFAHPSSYEGIIQSYNSKSKRKEVLLSLIKAFNEMGICIEGIEKNPPREDRFTTDFFM